MRKKDRDVSNDRNDFIFSKLFSETLFRNFFSIGQRMSARGVEEAMPSGAVSPGRHFYGKHKYVFEDIVSRLNNCSGDFKRLADVGYLELDDTTPPDNIDAAHCEAYVEWAHDAWEDFIKRMHGPVRKRPLIRIDNGVVESIVDLTGNMRGTKMCAQAHLIFRYCPLEWSESVFRWKVELKPTFS